MTPLPVPHTTTLPPEPSAPWPASPAIRSVCTGPLCVSAGLRDWAGFRGLMSTTAPSSKKPGCGDGYTSQSTPSSVSCRGTHTRTFSACLSSHTHTHTCRSIKAYSACLTHVDLPAASIQQFASNSTPLLTVGSQRGKWTTCDKDALNGFGQPSAPLCAPLSQKPTAAERNGQASHSLFIILPFPHQAHP